MTSSLKMYLPPEFGTAKDDDKEAPCSHKKSSLEDFFSGFRRNIIGYRQFFESPFGKKKIIYADWTASGRAYWPIEQYIQKQIMPFLGNTHTASTITGTL